MFWREDIQIIIARNEETIKEQVNAHINALVQGSPRVRLEVEGDIYHLTLNDYAHEIAEIDITLD